MPLDLRLVNIASNDADDLQESFEVGYGSGSGTAETVTDDVLFSCESGTDKHSLTFGVLTEVHDLPNIWGLAYSNLAKGDDNKIIPTRTHGHTGLRGKHRYQRALR